MATATTIYSYANDFLKLVENKKSNSVFLFCNTSFSGNYNNGYYKHI